MARCLSDDELLAVVTGRAPAPLVESARLHTGECATCRVLLAEAAKAERPAAPPSPEPGARVGRYTLRALLGAGGSGLVYEAFDEHLGRRVALKLVRARRHDAIEADRLLREARAMAQLWHPSVVAVFDAGAHDDGVFIAMELVEGETLAHWLRERARPWAEVLRLFVEAGRGLVAAHAAGIVHRDFKPENVLLGRDGRPRVTDFGLARAAAAAGDADAATSPSAPPLPMRASLATLTEAGALAGTPAFMAPEQFLGARADAATDQFNFCASLFASLYGELPFGVPAEGRAEGFGALVLAGQLREPPSGTEVPAAVHAVLARGLARERAARFPSMQALLDALEATLSARRARRWPVAVAVMGGAVATAALVLGVRARPPAALPTRASVVSSAAAAAPAPARPPEAAPPKTPAHAPAPIARARRERTRKPVAPRAREALATPAAAPELGDGIRNPYESR